MKRPSRDPHAGLETLTAVPARRAGAHRRRSGAVSRNAPFSASRRRHGRASPRDRGAALVSRRRTTRRLQGRMAAIEPSCGRSLGVSATDRGPRRSRGPRNVAPTRAEGARSRRSVARCTRCSRRSSRPNSGPVGKRCAGLPTGMHRSGELCTHPVDDCRHGRPLTHVAAVKHSGRLGVAMVEAEVEVVDRVLLIIAAVDQEDRG